MRWCIAGLLACLLLGACGRRAPSAPSVTADATATGGATQAEAEPSTAMPMAGLVEHFASKLPTIAPLDQPAAGAVAQWTWKDKPAEADVPAQPVTGQIGGQPFICRYASVSPDEEARKPTMWLRFSSQPRPSDGGLSLDDTNVNLEVPRPPTVGTWTRALKAEPEPTTAAFFAFQAAATPGATPSLVTGSRHDWACWLRVDKELGPVQEGGISSVVGRIVLVFDDAPQRSWIAGRFAADGRKFAP